MDSKQFKACTEAIINRVRQVLDFKQSEYANNKDVFSNFFRAAEIQHTNILVAWRGFWTKHLVSLLDYIENQNQFSFETLQEKIQDLIAYLIIFECMASEYYPSDQINCSLPVNVIYNKEN